MTKIQTFIWHEFADFYIEFVKHRLYNKKDESGLYTLYNILLSSIKMLAPFAPFITEELYQNYFVKFEGKKSIHLTKWPNQKFIDEKSESKIEILKDIISYLRKFKTNNGIKMKEELSEVIIEEGTDIKGIEDEIKEIMNVKKVSLGKTKNKTENGIGIEVQK